MEQTTDQGSVHTATLRDTLDTRPQEGREDDSPRQQGTRFQGKSEAEEVMSAEILALGTLYTERAEDSAVEAGPEAEKCRTTPRITGRGSSSQAVTQEGGRRWGQTLDDWPSVRLML